MSGAAVEAVFRTINWEWLEKEREGGKGEGGILE